MVEISIPDGKGITHGILNKLKEQNVDTGNLNASIWNKILEGAKQQNDSLADNEKFYTGGSEFISGNDDRAKKSWKENFVVAKGKVLTIADEVWKNIVAMITQAQSDSPQKPSETDSIPPHRTTEEQQEYNQVLNNAKNIVSDNAGLLGLSEEELAYVSSATTESISVGAARYDNIDNKLKFNINNPNTPETGDFIKTMIHEVTHASKKSERNTVAEERECETRAIKAVLKLLDAGKIQDFKIMGRNLSEFRDETVLNNFIEEWLTASGYMDRLSEN